MSKFTIPKDSDGITTSWLEEVLQTLDVRGMITSFQANAIGSGLGFMSEIVRVTMTYDDDTEASGRSFSIIAKFPSGRAEAVEISRTFNLYKREVFYYKELTQSNPIHTPDCYFAHFNPLTHDFVLLLEDVPKSEPVDQFDGCAVELADLVVREVADMHGFWWKHSQLSKLDWLTTLWDPMFIDELPRTFLRNHPISVGLLGDKIPKWCHQIGLPFSQALPGILHRLGQLPFTLVHGDLQLGNLSYFPQKQPSLIVYDWQMVLRGPGILDLVYFLTQNLTIADRRAHEKELLEIYRDQLKRHGVALEPQELWAAYRLACLFELMRPMTAGPAFDPSDTNALSMFECKTMRALTAIEDLDALSLLSN